MARPADGLSEEMIAWATSTLDDVRHRVLEEPWFERQVTGDLGQDRERLAELWGSYAQPEATAETTRELTEPAVEHVPERDELER